MNSVILNDLVWVSFAADVRMMGRVMGVDESKNRFLVMFPSPIFPGSVSRQHWFDASRVQKS